MERCKRIRLKLKLKQQSFAELIKCATVSISRWENAKNEVGEVYEVVFDLLDRALERNTPEQVVAFLQSIFDIENPTDRIIAYVKFLEPRLDVLAEEKSPSEDAAVDDPVDPRSIPLLEGCDLSQALFQTYVRGMTDENTPTYYIKMSTEQRPVWNAIAGRALYEVFSRVYLAFGCRIPTSVASFKPPPLRLPSSASSPEAGL